MTWLEQQRIRYTLRHHPISFEAWEALMHEAELFSGLSAVQKAHLRELTTLFLHRKTFSGVQGQAVSMEMAMSVAAQASLLILSLGLDYYDGWIEIVIYPGSFRVVRESTDEIGLVSQQDQLLSGESWSQGPVILSWDDVVASHPGHNVVLHEFAHKLDMLNGRANGMPPLHADMVRQRWTAAFSAAFEHLQRQLEHHQHPGINAYAATSPAEFFAVASEGFFTNPQVLQHQYPDVYEQLVLFYRQNPMKRWHCKEKKP
ncbi:Inner membrane protein [hydrothermal vent metagenome]|uniref:Inner membrane protein n=1 Tax=hydrothermal vent metagenome TaxID=652676 RepID=A0A3B0ZD31_9ZZZZ